MRYVVIFLVLIFSFCPLMAQEETLFNSEIESGWYGGPIIKTGPLNGHAGFFLGGQGGWILNHRFSIGGKGYMLVNPNEVEGLEHVTLGFGCGGVLLEYIASSNRLVHVSVESMVGLGGVYNDVNHYAKRYPPIDYTGDGCFVLEPGVTVMLNVLKNFRAGLGVTYRYVNGINYDPGLPYLNAESQGYEKITDSDLSGVTVQVVLKFGMF